MSKKDFTGGLSSLLGDQPDKPKRGRPTTSTRVITKSSQEGLREKETRATFIVNEELLDKLKSIAYWDRRMIKDVVNQALQEFIEKQQATSGAIKPMPKD